MCDKNTRLDMTYVHNMSHNHMKVFHNGRTMQHKIRNIYVRHTQVRNMYIYLQNVIQSTENIRLDMSCNNTKYVIHICKDTIQNM